MKYKNVVLVILDGFGYSEEIQGNAIAQAKTPFFDYIKNNYSWGPLEASGEAVGLPEGQIGSSEVGHMTIGAGKVLYQDLVRITKAIENNELEENKAVKKIAEHVLNNNSILHLAGMVSPGGVHSHQEHLHALVIAFKKLGITKIAIHAFTDGRDLPPQSGHEYLEELENFLEKEGVGAIASVQGRYYAMDRDNNWERIQKVEDAIFHCKGNACEFKKPSQLSRELYAQGLSDEHFEPHIIKDAEGKTIGIEQNDAIFFFNFRPDRMRQIVSRVLNRKQEYNLEIANLTEYDEKFKEVLIAFPPEKLNDTLSTKISHAGLTQVHIAETEKYAHATYFLNGGNETKSPGEEWVLVESRKDIATHDQAPEMKAKEITDKAIEYIKKGTNFLFINYANADMVGHTGNFEATVKAIEVLDKELKRLYDVVGEGGGVLVITADHGNAEKVIHEGGKHTAHTSNPIPIFITLKNYPIKKGGLSNVAPMVCELLGMPETIQS